MTSSSIETSIFLIFTGAALLATLALYARQAMIVAYIVLGIVLGPWGTGMVSDVQLVKDIAGIGVIFLLYLLGLDLLPRQLLSMLGEALWITVLSSLIFAGVGCAVGLAFGYPLNESIVVGVALMFSSTILGVKLMPTTALHHKHAGEMIVSILLLQDVIAIIALLLLQGYGKGGTLWLDIGRELLTLPVLILLAVLLERFVLIKLIERFDQIHEYIFLLAIAWCLGIAEMANEFGLSHEIGAFVAGVTLAASPIALFITEKLRPLRDFFLIIFFFSLGATFNMDIVGHVLVPALLLAALVLLAKPVVFRSLFVWAGETTRVSNEVGYRLGQISEFSFLVAVLAFDSGFIREQASYLVQLATLITFVVSSYMIVLRFPTPIAVSDRLRRD